MNYHLHLGRSGECETTSVSNWSNSQSWGRNPWSWSRRHLSTRSGWLQQHGSQKPHQPLPVSSQVLQRVHSPQNVGHVSHSGVFQGKYWGKGVGQTWHQCFQSKAKSWNLEAEIFWGILKNHAQVWDSKVALYVMLSQLMSGPVVHTGWTAKSSTRQLLQHLITISSVCYCLLRTYWCLTRLTEPSSTLSGITSRAQSSSLVASPGLSSCDCLGQPALPCHIKGLL